MEVLLTDLEKKLASAGGEDLRQTLCEQLNAAEARLRALVLMGMTPAAFQQARTCLVALETATDLLMTLVVPDDTGVHPLRAPISHTAWQAAQPAAPPPVLPAVLPAAPPAVLPTALPAVRQPAFHATSAIYSLF